MKNVFTIEGDIASTVLINNHGARVTATIDASFLPVLRSLGRTLYLHMQNTKANKSDPKHAAYYVVLKIQQRRVFLHRLVMQQASDIIDHINGDTADNRRSNLRVVSQSENSQNRNKLNSNNSSGVTGVYWSKRERRWMVYVRPQGVSIYIGRFNTKDAAVKANEKARALYYPLSKEAETDGYSITA